MKYLYSLLTIFVISIQCYAINITINDGIGSGSEWYSANRENDEIEPGTVTSQLWDMEQYDLNGNVLKITGGYNFTSPSGYGGFRPGDLFIDIDSNGSYDYVAIIGNVPLTYDVYAINSSSEVYNVYYSQNYFSNPWRYKSGGTLIETDQSIFYGYYNDSEGIHYTANLDFTWLHSLLNDNTTITLHNTMECGNDILMGRYSSYTVPEGSSVWIFFILGSSILFSIHRR